MKTNKLVKIFLSLFLLMGITTSCVQDDEFDTPQITCNEPDVTVNATIADVKALYTGSMKQITEDLVIEGYVVSNDEAGNFYRTLHFQDALENPTQGLQLDVDLQDMYTKYPVGKKIYLKIKDLYIDNYKGVIKLGGKYQLSNGNFAVGRLSATEIKDKLFRACDAAAVTPKVTTISEISDAMINTLIQFEKVEVAPESLCQSYAEKGKNTNVYLQDCNGKKIILRNSGYSTFYNQKLPLGSGTITAVLGKYGKDYQLTIRDTKDLVMNDARCDGSTFTCEAPKANATIQQVKDLYKTEKVKIEENLVFDATITANDADKNFYKHIYVQDETGAIRININLTGLDSKGYKIGQKIIVSAKNLYVSNIDGGFALGKPYTDKNGKERFGGIDAAYGHLYLQEENKPMEPTVITELKEESIGKLVQLNAVQFMEENIAFVKGSKGSENREISTCDGKLKLPVRTSSYATFAKENIPSGNGAIVGILSKYKTTYQLYIRNKKDYSAMKGERCEIASQAVFKTLADVRKLFTGTSATITEDIKIKAVVTSNKDTKNIHSQNAFAQDNTAGIALRFSADHNLALGDEVEIILKGTKLSEYNGLLQLNIAASNIKSKKAGTLPTPEVVTLEQALTGNYQGKLVSIKNIQFKDNTKNYKGNNFITNCEKELKVYINGKATFAEEKVNAKNGTITGVMSDYKGAQLYIRSTSDVNFTETYKTCGETGGGSGDSGSGSETTSGKLLFSGANFEEWETFKGALNKYGLKSYATQSNDGHNNSKALLIKGKPTRNDYVFTATVPEGFETSGKTKITFYIKGKVSEKSLSINIYNAEGKYKPFNLGDYTEEATIEPASSNQYTGAIDTAGKWLKVTLNISEISLAAEKGKNLFALKVGKGVDWDILIDDITIE